MTACRLVQHRSADGERRVTLAEGDTAFFLEGATTTRELALVAIGEGCSLADVARAGRGSVAVDLHDELGPGACCPRSIIRTRRG